MSSHDSRASRDPDKDPGSDLVITPRTKIPLSVLISAITFAALATAGFVSIKYDLSELKKHVNQDWMLQEQRIWASQVSKINPNFNTPDPDAIWKITHAN